ncbi:SDR family NAD(P)-dependent oxidoreductase [Kosakonia oryzae]|uniref:SDR family NAD(P)-dependent oxidoreductase n=1 Tax=Kosakonia oryzae TaxID=497725 RepID=UPI00221E5029|nr:SDR family NAD(P)-dependent oxidoreductase [Kosakonia oryzae]
MNEQRIALVTGANKGIGFEIARQLAQAGAIVIMGSRDNERGNAAVEALRAQGLSVQHCELDITRHDSIVAAASSINAEFGRLDILINNAGVFDHADGPRAKLPLRLSAR